MSSGSVCGESAGKAGGEPKDLRPVRDVWAWLSWVLPRTETVFLLLGLGFTMVGKIVVLVRQSPDYLFGVTVHAVIPDILFFAFVTLLLRVLHILKPRRSSARVGLLVTTIILAWSVADALWMMRSGVQLQPGMVVILLRDFGDLWPYIATFIRRSVGLVVLSSLLSTAGAAFVIWKLVYPGKLVVGGGEHLRRAMVKLAMMIVLLLSGLVFDAVTPLVFAEEVISFSSHWHAVIYSTVSLYRKMHSKIETRNIPVAGERQVGLPSAGADMPNVIVVLLESASYCETSLYDEKAGTTPFLAGLAEEGAEFTLTRVPVSHTTKAYWSALTSSTPVIEGNYVEAIPADKPYESMATILKRIGYRSGFFEMSRGSFECGPGFFKNMGFDWAWFRENLGDESANIGYFGGDDLRVIEPAMDWLTGSSGPGFVMMITSISHEPYDVPEWFEASKKEPGEKYLQTVRYTDFFLNKLCDEIARRGISENTLLCVIGDHGTSFRSDTNMARWCPYEEILRVPWVIRWPGHVEAGRKYDWPCSQADVAPTILSLLGCDISRAGFEGRDAFVPGPAERRLYFSSWYTDSPMGYVEGNRKIVYWPYLRKVFEYDLERDPEENSPRRIEKEDAEEIVKEILNWQHRSQMMIDPRRYTEDVFYSHWLTYSSGRSAWTYYAP